jgi:glycine cleavage system H protein
MLRYSRLICTIPKYQKRLVNVNNMRYSSDLSFTETGEWFVKENDTNVIGITKESLEKLSEVVFVESLVDVSDNVSSGDELIAIESVKATATIDAFDDCKIIDINTNLFDNLDALNNDPEDVLNSWIIKTSS